LYQQAELIETDMKVDLDNDPVFTEFGEICVRLLNLITTIEKDKNSGDHILPLRLDGITNEVSK
jgi:hypothetical protein